MGEDGRMKFDLPSTQEKGAVTFDEIEKARGEKKKVPLAVKKRQMRQYKVEFLRNSPNYYGLFLSPLLGLDNSLNGLGPIRF